MDRGACWAAVHVLSVYLLMATVSIHSAAGGHRLSPLLLPCVISALDENCFFLYDLVFQGFLTFSKGAKPLTLRSHQQKEYLEKRWFFPPRPKFISNTGYGGKKSFHENQVNWECSYDSIPFSKDSEWMGKGEAAWSEFMFLSFGYHDCFSLSQEKNKVQTPCIKSCCQEIAVNLDFEPQTKVLYCFNLVYLWPYVL